MSVDCLDLFVSLLAIFKKKNHQSKTEKMHFTVRIIKTRLVFQRISFGAKRNISVKRDVWNTYCDSLITKHVFRFIVSAGKWFFGSDSASYGF